METEQKTSINLDYEIRDLLPLGLNHIKSHGRSGGVNLKSLRESKLYLLFHNEIEIANARHLETSYSLNQDEFVTTI